ncbi:MAG: DUF3473 domain-containing protein [Candidatus Omnitrophica bacterium]|nr:DUF3473 domain-containing protein [Candidatus Omnitrophota bacterium]
MKNELIFFTVDVEDWFQVENLKPAIKKEDWAGMPLRVEANTRKLLDILDLYRIKATFFVVGLIIEKAPGLIREIHRRGHEVASHGIAHELVYRQEAGQFREDIRSSKRRLEDCVGEAVIGYRAPVFSIADWAIDILIEEGFRYDSSFFPVTYHDRYGKITNKNNQRVWELKKGFYEVSLSTLDFFKISLPWTGGYLRGIPYPVFKWGIRRVLSRRGSYVFYFHPWEIDYLQPRIKNIRWDYRIRQYIGLKGAENKIRRLLGDFSFTSIKEGLIKKGLL